MRASGGGSPGVKTRVPPTVACVRMPALSGGRDQQGLEVPQRAVGLVGHGEVVRGAADADETFQDLHAGGAELGFGRHFPTLLWGYSAPAARKMAAKAPMSAGPSKATYSGTTRCCSHFCL